MLFENPLHCLISPSGNRIIAHCLDYDLVVSADNFPEALRRLTFIAGAHVSTAKRVNADPALEHKAPQMYWDKFHHFMGDGSVQNINGVLCEVAQATSANALQ